MRFAEFAVHGWCLLVKRSGKRTALLIRPEASSVLPAVDLHLHTTFTDGKASISAMIEAAEERGLAAIAITEHVRASSDWLPHFWAAIEQARVLVNGMAVYHGIETKALDFTGTLDATPEMLERAELVLGAVHRYPDGRGGTCSWASLSPDEGAEIEYRAALGLIRNPQVDVLAHPGGVYELKFGPFPRSYLEEIVATAARHGVAIEINARYCRDIPGLLALCRQHGALVSLGSDAHSPSEVGLIVTRLREHGLCV